MRQSDENRRQTVGLAAVTTAVALVLAGIAWVAGRDANAPVPASPIVAPLVRRCTTY